MSNKEKYDWTAFNDPEGGLSIFGHGIRRSMSYDSYAGTNTFKARALTDMFPLTANQLMAIDGGVTNTESGNNTRYAFKARIIGANSPHSFLPNVCDPSYSGDQESTYKVISMHTTYISTDVYIGQGVTRGDIVTVEMIKSGQTYNMEYGRFIELSSIENPVDTANTECFSLVGLVGAWAPNIGESLAGATGASPSVVVGSAARAEALAAGVPLGEIKQFYSEIIKQVGGTPNDEILKFFGAWGNLEQPKTTNNPLATTHPGKDKTKKCRPWADDPKMTTFNNACVRNYSTFETGVAATVATLTNGYYPTIVNFVKGTSSFPTAIDALADAEVRKELDRWGSKGHKVYARLAAGKTDNPSTVITAPVTAGAEKCPADKVWWAAGVDADGTKYPAGCYDKTLS
jgi:hypothetical protein